MTKKRVLLIIAIAIPIILLIGWWIFSVYIYDSNINVRCQSYEPKMFRVSDFEGLECTEYSFPSNKGQKLAGYLYSAGEDQRGIVVLAHGYGGGQNSYMDCANYFAQNGYYVFAYDATGCDDSEGKGVGAAPQGVVDLDYAISFVESNKNIPDLPIVLFGHSWGAYSACNVLTYHPEVKAVVECAGFNRSSDMFESFAKYNNGDVVDALMPFVKFHELVHYGEYATNSALDAFEASKAHVMVVHSADDDVITPNYGYDIFYENYKDDSRFEFVKFEHRGHNGLYYDPENHYEEEFNTELNEWADNLPYNHYAGKYQIKFEKDKTEYINSKLDRAKWADRLDKELMDKFVDFYDAAIQ